jgi:hypothetical protein
MSPRPCCSSATPVAQLGRARLSVHGDEPAHADHSAAEHQRSLKAVALLDLPASLLDELASPVERLAGRPRNPLGEVVAVRLDQAVELLGVGLLELDQLAIVGDLEAHRLVSVADQRVRTAVIS